MGGPPRLVFKMGREVVYQNIGSAFVNRIGVRNEVLIRLKSDS